MEDELYPRRNLHLCFEIIDQQRKLEIISKKPKCPKKMTAVSIQTNQKNLQRTKNKRTKENISNMTHA
jgi:hypothetical protein